MTHLTHSTKTISEKEIVRQWHIVDVAGKVIGRVMPHISTLLQGKHKADYSPNVDSGDYVVVINAGKLRFTGDKLQSKMYDKFSGYPGGLHRDSAATLLKKNPSRIVIAGVSGMLPKNKLRDRRLARLFVFADEKHPYKSEQLKVVTI